MLRAGALSSVSGVLAGCLSHTVKAAATPVGLPADAARAANYHPTPRVKSIETMRRGPAGPFTHITASITSYVVQYAVSRNPETGASAAGPEADVLTFFVIPELSVGGRPFNGLANTDFPGIVASQPDLFDEFCACPFDQDNDLTVRQGIAPTETQMDGDTDMYVVPGSAVGAAGDVTLLGHRLWPGAFTAAFIPDGGNGTAYYAIGTKVLNETSTGRDAVFAAYVGKRGLLTDRNFGKADWRLLARNGEVRALFKRRQVDAFNRRFLSVLGAVEALDDARPLR